MNRCCPILDANATEKKIADYKFKVETSLQSLKTLDGAQVVRSTKAQPISAAKMERQLKHKSSKPGSEGNRFITNDQL